MYKSNFAVHSRSGFAGGKTFVLWDVEVCPIPDGLGPHDVFSNIKRVLMDNGYRGDVSTTPYTDLTKSNGDRDARLEVYMIDLYSCVVKEDGPLNLMLFVGDISSRSKDFFRVFRLLQSSSSDSSVPLSLTQDGICKALTFGEEVIIRECGERRKVPNSD
ncbi:hypothetical protein ISN45_At03g049710 [Arabidopsis thaliana x Arabidopsis arenosa]|uniref:Endonuclease or glycosyl hydrolase n=2 Tax=Arabidopsis TaxID=3701 RepID=A0A1I9LLH0_ARATH|nr:Putative endonuclease or glycosyl hydrolase [Arabidopsis thaliana]ANM63428.1 Putative endonuclease or glycosyl hydrolase [Arabidopsis thaliana]KAG7628769.1 hypothetical protein ISN45_At03g049710 [Arabidopsis thaliana x Arabidopsis arenosa]|eukprot:NP_001325516.1 Putative endonuclease or glycosyl hydrolase [Arabidopsis thaliana]